MEVVGLLTPFVLLGLAVLYVAFSGGPGRAREAYLTRGGTAVKLIAPVIFIGFGVAIPAMVVAGSSESTGATPLLAAEPLPDDLENGKRLFRQNCASCHSLAAVNARGVTGPGLDDLGGLNRARVLSAIRVGGTGKYQMPAGLLEGENAEDVAAFLEKTAEK